jgi:hypothetical protein
MIPVLEKDPCSVTALEKKEELSVPPEASI